MTTPPPSPSVAELYIQTELQDPDFQQWRWQEEAIASLDNEIEMSELATAVVNSESIDSTPALTSNETAAMGEPQEAESTQLSTQTGPVKTYQTRSSTGCSKKESHDYVLRFKGNDSRKWDGKNVTFDGEWLEETYDKAELCPGRVLDIPYNGRGWRMVVVSVPNGGKQNGNGLSKWLSDVVHKSKHDFVIVKAWTRVLYE